jgi:hypothetical protein
MGGAPPERMCMADTSMTCPPADGAGAGGASPGGAGGADDGSDTCGPGDHSHPLTVPGSDVDRGAQDGPYTLEDGGTGHTHQLFLSAYDFLYLAGGTAWTVESTETEGHTHMCTITCPVP